MKIGENEKTFVALSYELTVDGEVVEKVTAESPLQFIYGAGFLLPNLRHISKAFQKEMTLLSIWIPKMLMVQ